MISGSDLFLQIGANTLAAWGLLLLAAIGFGLLYRTLRVFHIAYAFFIGAAGYALFACVGAGVPLAGAIPLAIASGVVAAALLELAIFGPLVRLGGAAETGMIASLGTFGLCQSLLTASFGFSLVRIPLGQVPGVVVGDAIVSAGQLVAVGLGLGAMACLSILERSLLGVRMRAYGDNPRLMALSGVRLGRLRVLTWTIATTFAAMAGMVMLADVGLGPQSGMQLFLAGAVAVFLGGVDRPVGWIIAALVLALAQNLAPLILEARWATNVIYAVALAILIARPSGIVGTARRAGRVNG